MVREKRARGGQTMGERFYGIRRSPQRLLLGVSTSWNGLKRGRGRKDWSVAGQCSAGA